MEESWDDDDEAFMVLPSSQLDYSTHGHQTASDHRMERAEDFLLADDPAQFSDTFSDPEEWDLTWQLIQTFVV